MKTPMTCQRATNNQIDQLRSVSGVRGGIRMGHHALWMSCIVCLLSAVSVQAGPRASANYCIAAENADSGGKRATSVSYSHDGSTGGITGVSSVVSPAQTAKQGYIGQLTEVTALQIAVTPATVNEAGTCQLSAAALLDDQTTNTLSATSIFWSVQSGPLTGINSNGLVAAGTVYQNTAATAQGSYAGFTGTLGLTVLDTLSDNFGSYAADGLDDDWQAQYFGQDNPLAAPLLDPDGDGQNNAFEFTAGLVPTNPLSRFLLTIAPVPGQPGQKVLIFEPVVAGRTYVVKTSPDLSPTSWTSLSGGTVSENGSQRTVTDTSASEAKKFYKVEIVKP
jgi:energy-converting hydrogenase Eha subunit B